MGVDVSQHVEHTSSLSLGNNNSDFRGVNKRARVSVAVTVRSAQLEASRWLIVYGCTRYV